MEFSKDKFISNLYETSKSKDENRTPLLSSREQDKQVYDFDEFKKWFCETYRSGKEIKSCDAFYVDEKNAGLIEFKNTHHYKFKQYMEEFDIKFVDSHMLLAEAWYTKRTKIAKDVIVIVVYKDAKRKQSKSLLGMMNNMAELSKNDEYKMYGSHEEYEHDVDAIINRFKGTFYRDVIFIEYQDFKEVYLDCDWFKSLQQ